MNVVEKIKITPSISSKIQDNILLAINLANENKCAVYLKFNDVKLRITKYYTLDSGMKEYYDRLR